MIEPNTDERRALKEALDAKARTLRLHAIQMIGRAQSGHPGGSLSAADIISVLYFHQLRYRADDPSWPDRDRFVLSKGHAAPTLYAALAEAGFFPVAELPTLRQLGGRLEGHPDMRKVPGIEISTGSLGQGLAAANGMALALRLDGRDSRIYVLLGDGESQEGEVWEAAMFASHYRLNHVVGIVDYNDLQIDGRVSEIMEVQPLVEKWQAFGWESFEVDGHDVLAVADALAKADAVTGKPTMIVARTVKCKGVSFMEDKAEFHGKPPTEEQLEAAIAELTCVEVLDDIPGGDGR